MPKIHRNSFNRKRKQAAVLLSLVIQLMAGAGVPIVYAENALEGIQEPANLYAQAAVLMDADSGRILFAKNGQEERAMASTTKIMTCILALEQGDLDETVTASANAAIQPEVRLGVREGQQFKLRDLLYSLMLESHNDSAVVIAESVGGTVEGFADMMNAKAEKLNCKNTYFITPNGLDGEDESGTHHTTAEDLARIMKYCIMDSPQKSLFLEITQTPDYQFSDAGGVQTYSCNNHNAFLQMMEGALSGKTGFTSQAGYCYVGALESEGRTFVVSLLACGWPNNKGYKWADTKKLMAYGMEHFHYQTFEQQLNLEFAEVIGGIPNGNALSGTSSVETEVQMKEKLMNDEKESDTESNPDNDNRNQIKINRLLRDDEEIRMEYSETKQLTAPVEKGEKVGMIRLFLNDEELYTAPIKTAETVPARTFSWCAVRLLELFLP